MKLVLSSLLLASMCTLSSWSVSWRELDVTQSPDNISIQEGGMANISCCWTGVHEKMRVIFKKKHTNSTHELKETRKTNSGNCSDLIIKNVSLEDSGIYICKVTVIIPGFIEEKGNGTVVTVIPKGGEENNDNGEGGSAAVIALGILGPLLLVALTCFCIVLRRKRGQAARLIYEVPHVDSDVDKHSTSSSTGSSQWRQVLVYESVDYFQHRETKESE